MALIKCSACGAYISSRATVCPRCGATHEQQEELYAEQHEKKTLSRRAIALWIAAAVVIIRSLYQLPTCDYHWHRSDINTLYIPFCIAAVLASLGFMIKRKGSKTAVKGAIISSVAIGGLLFFVYCISSPDNYREDIYGKWYRDNVLCKSAHFRDDIDGTAWRSILGEVVINFKYGNVEILVKSHGDQYYHMMTGYTVNGTTINLGGTSVISEHTGGHISDNIRGHISLRDGAQLEFLTSSWSKKTITTDEFVRIRPEELGKYNFSYFE